MVYCWETLFNIISLGIFLFGHVITVDVVDNKEPSSVGRQRQPVQYASYNGTLIRTGLFRSTDET